MDQQTLWQHLVKEAQDFAAREPALKDFLDNALINQPNLESVISQHLAKLLDSHFLSEAQLSSVIDEALSQESGIMNALCRDIVACYERDAACDHYLMPLLYFKGFHALQAYRISHWLFTQERHMLAFYFQNLISQNFGVDIHPAAQIGSGIMIDHATGVVVGETAVIEDNVSMLHSVTLGGTGTDCGRDRHPKIRRGVLLATGAKVLGNVEVGEGAKVAAGSLVLEDVPAHTTVAGVPARIVGRPTEAEPARSMDQDLDKQQ